MPPGSLRERVYYCCFSVKSLLIQAPDLRRLVERVGIDAFLDDVVTTLTRQIVSLDPGQIDVPARSGFAYPGPPAGLLEWMPSYIRGRGASVKIVGYHPNNPRELRLPTILSSVFVFDTQSGHLKGLLDATVTTAVRTGAMSALASRILALESSRTLGIIGCGAQAVTQAHALSRIFPLERIVGYDVDPVAAGSFARRVAFLGIEVEMVAADALDSLVREADILCTCTSEKPGRGPVFRAGEVKPHLHINAVGSDFPGKTEVPIELLHQAVVCPDFPAQAMREGECQLLAPEAVGPNIVELLRQPSEFTGLRNKLTVFDSTGWALVDHLVALEVLELARSHGVGQEIDLESVPPDANDPYSFLGSTKSANARAGA